MFETTLPKFLNFIIGGWTWTGDGVVVVGFGVYMLSLLDLHC